MITLAQQLSELKRELGVRKRIYPKWVAKGTLDQATAEHRIAALEAAIETVEKSAGLGKQEEMI